MRNLAKQVMNLLKLRKQNFQLSESLLKIEAKNKELEQFAYITAHDLQEPLRTITSFIQLFKEEFGSEMDETQKTYFDFISKASNRMSEQIRSLLEYSRLGSRGKKDWIDTSKLVEELKNDLTDICSRNNGEIISSTLPKIYGYTVEFRLLLQNLICNGIKFRKKEQNPIIQITCMETDNEWIFCVEDNGIGIENRHFEKIFAIFQRLNNHEDYEGTGIGLAHCKKIVSLHKGEIWVESIINEGSKFFFSISKQL